MRRMAQYLEDCDRQHRRNERARTSRSVLVQKSKSKIYYIYSKNIIFLFVTSQGIMSRCNGVLPLLIRFLNLDLASNRSQTPQQDIQNTPIRRHLVEDNPNYDVRIVRVPRSTIPHSVKVFFGTGSKLIILLKQDSCGINWFLRTEN